MPDIQLYPPRGANGVQPARADLLPGSYEYILPVGTWVRGTYAYSLNTAPVAAEAATIEIFETVSPTPDGSNDEFPLPVEGLLANPGALTVQSRARFNDRAMSALIFRINVVETLVGFRLYATGEHARTP